MSGAKEVLYKVAAIAHSGGLIGQDPQDALAAIRQLSLSYWLKEHNPEQVHATLTQQSAAVDGALWQAARSLRTIADQAGKTEGMEDMQAVRGYANSRATVAEAALAARKGEET